VRYRALATLHASLTFAFLGCDGSTGGTPQPLQQVDASTMVPSTDASMDAAPVDDSGWDPDSGLPRECVVPPKPLIEPSLLARCPNCAGEARCVPRVVLETQAPEMAAKLMACDDDSLCIPDPLITSMGFYKPDSCRSVNDAEGRCLSECLPQASCGEGNRCVPCFDPISGNETGACSLTCDPGPTEPAKPLTQCCHGLGLCVPSGLVPADQAARLGADSCGEGAGLCAPRVLMDAQSKLAQCTSLGGSEGRCLPSCLPQVADQADRLPQDSCAEFEVCAPCFDPFSGADTDVCRLHGDAPTRPASPFPHCCGELGTCVPKSLVSEGDAKKLPQDSCDPASAMCVPNAFLDESFVPQSCRSLGDAEGRCIPGCLLPAGQKTELVPQSSCATGELCAPCFNPIDGAATGVCVLRGDAPKEPPVRFDTACCAQSGRCIPEVLAGAQGKVLPADRCQTEHGDGWLCAPKRVIEDPARASNPFEGCKIRLGFFSVGRGKCVPNCMIETKGWVKRLLQRASCDSGESCVPCSLGGVPGC
jgi:hypothetical protein